MKVSDCRLLAFILPLFVCACADKPPAQTPPTDTAQAAVAPPAVTPAPEPEPEPVVPAPHVAFTETSYSGAVGQPLSITAFVTAVDGSELPDEVVRMGVQDPDVAFLFTPVDTKHTCAEYTGTDRHAYAISKSRKPLGVCGLKNGSTTLHVEAMANLTADAPLDVR
jgi:hypothetical protein